MHTHTQRNLCRRLVHLGMIVMVTSFASSAAPQPSEAQGMGACIGDCDANGTVTINEIIVGVGIALGSRPVSDCPSFDADGSQTVTVDEIVMAVAAALNGCTSPTPSSGDFVRASSGVALTAMSSVDQVTQLLNFGSAGVPTGGGAAGALRHHSLTVLADAALAPASAGDPSPASGGAAQQLTNCALSGTVESSCNVDNAGNYTLDAFYSDCDFFDDAGSELLLNGSLQEVAADPIVCGGGIPSAGSVSFSFANFDALEADPDGTITERSTTQLLDLIVTSGEGCNGPDSGQGLDGDLYVQVSTFDGTVLFEVEYFATQFIIATRSTGSPCVVGYGVDGALDVFNDLTSEETPLIYSQFIVSSAPRSDGSTEVILEGGVNNVCYGTIQLATLQNLRFDTADALCPSAGVLQVTLPDQTISQVTYRSDGVDFNGDGSADVSSCLDPSIQQCPGECLPCNTDADCPGMLGCFDCSFDCAPNAVARCAPTGESVFATCSDGSF